MFRPLRRKKRAITDEEARKLLATCKRGVFAVNGDDGYPYAIPVNYFFDAEHDKIYFHGAKAGHKVDALKRDDKVCFTVYGNEWYKDDDWAPYVMSTVVFGRCRLANDTPTFIEDKVRELALKYYPTAEEVEEEIAKDTRVFNCTRLRLSISAASRFTRSRVQASPSKQIMARFRPTLKPGHMLMKRRRRCALVPQRAPASSRVYSGARPCPPHAKACGRRQRRWHSRR